MSLFYVGQTTCSKIHLKTLQMVLWELQKHFNPAIIQSTLIAIGGIFPRDASWSIKRGAY